MTEPARSVQRLRLLGSSNTNKVMAAELSRLAPRALSRRAPEPKKYGTGALLYPFDVELAALCVRYHRTSARVLWDLFECSARRLEPLYAELVAALAKDDRRYVWDGVRISVAAFGVGDFPAGERQIVGTVKNAVIEAAGRRGFHAQLDPEKPDVQFSVRGVDGALLVSIDLAGRPMHQRGYRTAHGEAPLREDVAAGLVMMTRHDARTEALLDPMAGSGTIAIEAACLASARPLWHPGRVPLAERLPDFRDLMRERPVPLFAGTEPVVFANELDAASFDALSRNLKTSGMSDCIAATRGDFAELSPAAILEQAASRGAATDRGVILTNPPYGHRVGDNVRLLYTRLRDWCRAFGGWRLGVLVANSQFEEIFGRPRIKKPVRNGPLKAYFLLYDL